MQTFMAIITPVLAALASALVPLAGAAIIKLFQKWGIEIEAQHRDALQSALRNAVLAALARVPGGSAAGIPINIAVDYVNKSVPDAVKKFGLDDDRIRELLKPHIQEVTQPNPGDELVRRIS